MHNSIQMTRRTNVNGKIAFEKRRILETLSKRSIAGRALVVVVGILLPFLIAGADTANDVDANQQPPSRQAIEILDENDSISSTANMPELPLEFPDVGDRPHDTQQPFSPAFDVQGTSNDEQGDYPTDGENSVPFEQVVDRLVTPETKHNGLVVYLVLGVFVAVIVLWLVIVKRKTTRLG